MISQPTTTGISGSRNLDQAAKDAAFCLAAKTEKNEIVAREQGIDDLRDDRVLIAVNAGKERFVALDGGAGDYGEFRF